MLYDPIYLLLGSVGQYTTKLVGALGILIIGWIVALIVSSVVYKALKRINITERIAGRLMKEEKAKTEEMDRWISKGVYYLILFFVLVAFFQVLGLTLVVEPINRLLVTVFEFAPRLVAGTILVLIAWVIATVLKTIIFRGLTQAKLDERFRTQARIEEKKEVPLAQTISNAVYWLVWLLFLPLILDALALQGLLGPIQIMINKILAFLPNLLGAAVILIVGWFIARIIQRIVTNLLMAFGADRLSEKVGLSKALGDQGLSGLLGMIVYVLILIPVLIAAIQALSLEAITQPATNMLNTILNALPSIFGAFLILAISYVIGRVVAEIITNLLKAMGFDYILDKLGIGKEPAPGERTPSQVVGYLTLVAIMFFAAVEASQILGFALLADLISQFIVFAGHVILGLLIFAIGIYLANLAYRTIMSSKTAQAGLLAMAARLAILLLAAAMGLRQMGLANEIINLAFGLLLGAVAIAVAIAFGLGGREIAAKELEKWRQEIK